MSMLKSLTRKPEFYGTVVTEVQVTSDTTLPPSKLPVARPPQAHMSTYPRRSSIPGHHELHGHTAIPGVGSQNFETVCSSDCQSRQENLVIRHLRAMKLSYSLKLKRLDPVKVSYLRTSFIFAFAVLITWIPSSINRLYSLSHNGDVSFELSLASGCVLPLQGVWNAIIFLTTS